MALLAYKEPEKSPMFHLLSLEYRQQVADSLNRAILGWLTCYLHIFNIFCCKSWNFLLSMFNVIFFSVMVGNWQHT